MADTDVLLREMEKRLSGIYTRAQKEIGESWVEYLIGIDQEVSDLQIKYDNAKKSGNKEEARKYGRQLSAVKRERTLGDEYYRDLTRQTAAQISAVNQTAVAYINGQLPEVYSLGYNGIAANLNKEAYSGISFTMVDANTVKSLVTEDKTLLPYKKINGRKDVRWNTQKINSEVLQGILQGEPMPKVAKRLENVLGMNETSAIRNARTAVTGAENRGRLDMLREADKNGVHTRKVWSAIHDNRTRHSHEELDGQEAEIDEPFYSEFGEIMMPGDPDADPADVYNCRCRLRYKIVGFERNVRG